MHAAPAWGLCCCLATTLCQVGVAISWTCHARPRLRPARQQPGSLCLLQQLCLLGRGIFKCASFVLTSHSDASFVLTSHSAAGLVTSLTLPRPMPVGEGRTYYYNTVTGVSQWEKPADM